MLLKRQVDTLDAIEIIPSNAIASNDMIADIDLEHPGRVAETLLRRSETELELEVAPARLRGLCAGHFPDEPLVPGAYLVGLAVDQARRLNGPVDRVVHAAFRAPSTPERSLLVHARSSGLDQTLVELAPKGADQAARCRIHHGAPFELAESSRPEGPSSSGAALLDHAAVRAALRHREPALFIDAQLAALERGGDFVGLDRPRWHWTQLLDAAAQAAGLVLRHRASEPILAVYVAAFERLGWASDSFEAKPRLRVRIRRRVMHLVQFDFEVDGIEQPELGPWMSGSLALAVVSEAK